MITREEFKNYCEIFKKNEQALHRGGDLIGAFFFEDDTPVSVICDYFVYVLADHLPSERYTKEENRDILWDLLTEYRPEGVYLEDIDKTLKTPEEFYDLLIS